MRAWWRSTRILKWDLGIYIENLWWIIVETDLEKETDLKAQTPRYWKPSEIQLRLLGRISTNSWFSSQCVAAEIWKIAFFSSLQNLSIPEFSFLPPFSPAGSHLLLTQAFSPYFIQLRLLIYTPTPAFILTLQHLQHSAKCSLVKSFHFFLISCSSVTSLPPYPSQNWHVAAEARPDVEHISLDHKATYAIKTER